MCDTCQENKGALTAKLEAPPSGVGARQKTSVKFDISVALSVYIMAMNNITLKLTLSIY